MVFKSKNTKNGKLKLVIMILIGSGILLTVLLWFQGIFIPNNFGTKHHPVKGVDVSSYQGDQEQLDGYSGEEKFIDLNVFNGSENEFKEYGH